MKTKDCPSCGATVPAAAARCKECFHDFHEDEDPKSSSPMALVVALAVMAVIGALAFWNFSKVPTDRRILVDESSQTVQWISQYKDGSIETEQVAFAQIAKLTLHISSRGQQSIIAVGLDGEEHMIQEDNGGSLTTTAERYAELMNKPLEVIDDTTLRPAN